MSRLEAPVASSSIARRRPVESAAAAGIVFSFTSVASLVLLRATPYRSDAEVTAWRIDDANRTRLAIGLSLASVAAVALLWFVAVVRRRVGDREDRFFATAFLGSAIVYACLWAVGTTLFAASALVAGGELDLESGRLADAVATGLLFVVGPRIQAVFVASSATIFLRTSVLPNWLGYLGYVAAVILFTVPIIASPLGLAMPVYVLVVSVTILVVRSRFDRV